MNNLSPLLEFKTNVLDKNKIKFNGGASGTVNIGSLA
jgi:hypothetical protein